MNKSSAILLSFTATLDEIVENDLKEHHFRDAIFCFGCSQWLATEAEPFRVLKMQQKHQRKKVTEETIRFLQEQTIRAEREGRTIWRKSEPVEQVFAKMNKLLKQCGLNPLKDELESDEKLFDSKYLRLAIAMKNREHAGLLQIIC